MVRFERPLVAVSLNDENYRERIKRAKESGADAVEYRVDAFEDQNLDHCEEVIRFGNSLGLKGILTVRSREEGGVNPPADRLPYFERLTPLVDFVDVELRSEEEELEEVRRLVKCENKLLILSYHDFEKTPPEEVLNQIFTEMVEKGADLAKVAVKADDYSDAARLLCVAARQPVPTVAIAMGEKGKVSRVAGFAFNSVITYCALDRAFAPGQLTVEDARKIIEQIFLSS
ncbi:MAG: type I 3-dehydroquinate dehydratase [Aquificae bacterium]|nr:type I 3-dehydroquinate dehydratase [Aquificota bacterium]